MEISTSEENFDAKGALAFIRAYPYHHFSFFLQGKTALQEREWGAAEYFLLKAIELEKTEAEYRYQLGMCYFLSHRLEESLLQFRLATKVDPYNIRPYIHLAAAYRLSKQPSQAIASLRKALHYTPHESQLIESLIALRDDPEHLQYCLHLLEEALIQNPLSPSHRKLAGQLCHSLGLDSQAIEHYRVLCKEEEKEATHWVHLGVSLKRQGELLQAKAAIQQALALEPSLRKAPIALAEIERQFMEHEAAFLKLKRAACQDPFNTTVISCLLFSSNYVPTLSPQERSDLHMHWGKRFAKKSAGKRMTPTQRNTALRIGYVSSDFHGYHPVQHFIEHVILNHNLSRVVPFCYAHKKKRDSLSSPLQNCAGWREVSELSDKQLARQITRDKIDILVDLSGHTAQNRLRVFCSRPAPIQASYLGYANTSGLEAIQYRITDLQADPPSHNSLYQENLVRLPYCFLCYKPPKYSLSPSQLPFFQNGVLTFGCFNNPLKLNDDVLSLWAKILLAIPRSRLVLKGFSFRSREVRLHYAHFFAAQGLSKERVLFHKPCASRRQHLTMYHGIDIALDPFPYNGTTTSCEALWMGVPVLTLQGHCHAARVGTSIAHHVGLKDWIASSQEEYIRIAKSWALQPEKLSRLRQQLRMQLLHSPLCATQRFVHDLEMAFHAMFSAKGDPLNSV